MAAATIDGVTAITSLGISPPDAVATSAASGVTPATWKRPTAPDEAAAAPKAFSASSPGCLWTPATTPIAVPASRP